MNRRRVLAAVLLLSALLTSCKNSDSEGSREIPKIETETKPISQTVVTDGQTTAESSQAETTEDNFFQKQLDSLAEQGQLEEKLRQAYNDGYEAGKQEGIKGSKEAAEYRYAGWQQGMKDAQNYYASISGDFTATVRRLMPDYLTDSETNRAAAVTLFDGKVILLYLEPDITAQLEEGGTYTFVLKEQLLRILPDQLNEEQQSLRSEALFGAHLEISQVREPQGDEAGADCCRITAVKSIPFLEDE